MSLDYPDRNAWLARRKSPVKLAPVRQSWLTWNSTQKGTMNLKRNAHKREGDQLLVRKRELEVKFKRAPPRMGCPESANYASAEQER